MSDDATAGHWEPPADQPITPAEPAAPPPPSWVAPAYGPPPSCDAPSSEPAAASADAASADAASADASDAPSPTSAVEPPPASFVYPAGAHSAYRVDYLESPPRRRRSPAMFVAIGLVVLIVIGVGGGLISTNSGHSSAGVAHSAASPLASAPANPQPQDSAKPSPTTGAAPAPNAPAPSTQVGPLDAYLLPPGAVGSGALMALIPGGRSVSDQATLDFCNYDYTSESLRDARVQVQYVSGGQSASNEFVRYRSGGAAAAFSEIKKAIAGCPSSYDESGGEVSGIHRLTGLTGLAKDNAAVSFTSTYTGLGGVARQATTVIYQFDGDFFSGVYVYGTDATTVQAAAAKLAATSAKLLAEAAAGKPGTGGGPLTTAPSGEPGVQA